LAQKKGAIYLASLFLFLCIDVTEFKNFAVGWWSLFPFSINIYDGTRSFGGDETPSFSPLFPLSLVFSGSCFVFSSLLFFFVLFLTSLLKGGEGNGKDKEDGGSN
jgi:hypothetical protein